MTHPAVLIAQALGIPDPRWTRCRSRSSSCAPGTKATEEELIAYCQGAIARFKVPRHVRFVDEWPMSATKVQKFRLRERIMEAAEVERGTVIAVQRGRVAEWPCARRGTGFSRQSGRRSAVRVQRIAGDQTLAASEARAGVRARATGAVAQPGRERASPSVIASSAASKATPG